MNRFGSILLFVLISSLTACGSTPDATTDEPPKSKSSALAAQELFVRGTSKLDNREYEAAINDLDEAAELQPERWDIHMNRAIAYSRINKFSEALNAIEASLRNGGEKEVSVYFNLGNIYQERGMYSAAVDAYRAGLAVASEPDIDSLVNLGAAYLFLYDYAKADATFNHLRSIVPDDPRPVHGLALSLQMQNQYGAAADVYEEVHLIDPGFALAYFNKSQCLAATDRYDEAVRALRAYMQKAPDGPYRDRAESLIIHYESKAN